MHHHLKLSLALLSLYPCSGISFLDYWPFLSSWLLPRGDYCPFLYARSFSYSWCWGCFISSCLWLYLYPCSVIYSCSFLDYCPFLYARSFSYSWCSSTPFFGSWPFSICCGLAIAQSASVSKCSLISSAACRGE